MRRSSQSQETQEEKTNCHSEDRCEDQPLQETQEKTELLIEEQSEDVSLDITPAIVNGNEKPASTIVDSPQLKFEPKLRLVNDFFYEDKLIAQDEIDCIEAAPLIKKFLEENLKEEVPATYSFRYAQEAIRNVIQKMEHDNTFRPSKTNWYDSRYFRYLLNLDSSMSYERAVKPYSAGPVNLRLQTVRACGAKAADQNNEMSWFRIGVITDPTNGYTNLQELKGMRLNKKLYRQKIDELLHLKTKYEPTTRIWQSLDYALHELDDLHSTIVKRRHILRDQMALLTLSQLIQNKAQIANLATGDKFPFVHIGLLNEESHHIKISGWVHDEKNEMLDMREIFDEFKGKKIIFEEGLNDPYLDAQGCFHFPKETDNCPNWITIEPIFFNISVQGNTKNTPAQAEINQKSEKQLRDFIPPKQHPMLDKAFHKLSKGNSCYDIAFYLACGLCEKKIALSLGCFSTKDRTGVLCEFLVRYFVKALIEEMPCLDKNEAKQRKRYFKKLYQDVLSDQNNAKVIAQNTGSRIIKTTSLLDGKINPVDKTSRLKYFFKQLTMKEKVI